MKESQIFAKAKQELEGAGFTVWKPAKVKFAETDIFGIFDLIAVRRGDLPYFIQLTTYSNASKRCRKIMDFFARTGSFISHSYVWAYQDGSFRKYVVLPSTYNELKK